MPGPSKHRDRPLGISLLSLFFAAGAVICATALVALLAPGSFLEPMWRINPQGHEGFVRMGTDPPFPCEPAGERLLLMAISTYRTGTPRKPNEGLRLGTFRFLPRGVRKTEYARGGWLDVWLPLLAPSARLIKSYRSGPMDEKGFARLAKRYRAEVARSPEARQVLRLVAVLSREIPLAVGCTCEEESRCHRSVLVEMIREEARKG